MGDDDTAGTAGLLGCDWCGNCDHPVLCRVRTVTTPPPRVTPTTSQVKPSLHDFADTLATPLTEVTEGGLRTISGEYDVDLIAWATGFDAVTGSLTRINIRSGNTTLKDFWSEGPHTYLGLQVPGFPNLFIVGGPATYGNAPRSAEDQVDFVTSIVKYASALGHTRVQCSNEAADSWTRHADELASQILVADTAWFTGANVPGKAKRFLVYLGGLPTYREKTRSVANAGYEGFIFDASELDMSDSLV